MSRDGRAPGHVDDFSRVRVGGVARNVVVVHHHDARVGQTPALQHLVRVVHVGLMAVVAPSSGS